MLVFETLKNKKSDFLNSNTCFCSRLYGRITFPIVNVIQIFEKVLKHKLFAMSSKQKSYKCDRLRDSWLTDNTRPMAAVIWSHCQPTLPNIRILFECHRYKITNVLVPKPKSNAFLDLDLNIELF